MSEFEDLPAELQRSWEFVAGSNDRTLVDVYKGGDVQKAFSEFDGTRDEGVLMAIGHPDFQNEIECRRLEFRILAAFHTKDHDLICETIQDAGKSRRFSRERLHEYLEVIGGLIRDLGKRQK